MNINEWLMGSPDKLTQVRTGTPQQDQLHNQQLQNALGMGQQGGGYQNAQNYYNSFLGDYGGQGGQGNQAFQNFAAPFMNQFNEQTLPNIAERFAGAGALSSSGFGQALGGAASGLQSQLANLFAQLQSQAAGAQTNQYNQMSQTGLNHNQFAYQNQQGSMGMFGPLMAGMGMGMGGPMGSMLGQGITSGINSLFKKSGAGGGF